MILILSFSGKRSRNKSIKTEKKVHEEQGMMHVDFVRKKTCQKRAT